ncbi:unnamed protein product [Microthlaspi erraticum]|uniref:Uncharacterized protein n=1 Tax=Microthlaspi erraticum TaxID=1685480 RepID=A0A6D2JWR4_9BRAS|nr:unnamed protein product [Microthlaspi erraticum]
MTRRKSPVVLPQPATPVLRRSARLISLQNRDGQVRSGKDLAFRSEPPPRRSGRKLVAEVSGRLAFEDSSSKKSPGSNSSIDGFPTPRRSLRISKMGFSDAGKEEPSRCDSAKPAVTPSSRVKSTNASSSFTLRRSPRFSSGGGSLRRSPRFSSGGGSGNCVLSRCSTNSISSEKGNGGDSVRSRDRSRSRSRSRSRPRPKTKQMFRDSDDNEEEEVNCVLSKSCTKSVSSEKGNEGDGVRSRDRSRSRSRPPPKTKQMFKDIDEEEEKEEVTEKKRMRLAKENEEENAVPKADEGKRIEMEVVEEEGGLKTKNKLEKGWTEELEPPNQKFLRSSKSVSLTKI